VALFARPGGQEAHVALLEAPGVAEAVPAGQATQVAAEVAPRAKDHVPARQSVQEEVLASAAYLPAPQSMQDAAWGPL
jgi:hypothetical protein